MNFSGNSGWFLEKNSPTSPNWGQMPMARAFDDGEVSAVTSS